MCLIFKTLRRFFVYDPMQTSAQDSRCSDEDTDTRSVSQASESDPGNSAGWLQTFFRIPLDTIGNLAASGRSSFGFDQTRGKVAVKRKVSVNCARGEKSSLGALLFYVYSSGTFIMQSTYRPIYVCSVWLALSYLVGSSTLLYKRSLTNAIRRQLTHRHTAGRSFELTIYCSNEWSIRAS